MSRIVTLLLSRCIAPLIVLLSILTPRLATAQSSPAWTKALPARATRFQLLPNGAVLVQTRSGLFVFASESGEPMWSRTDVSDFRVIPGAPFVYLTTERGTVVADLDSGKDRWNLASLPLTAIKGRIDLPERGLVLAYGPTKEVGHAVVAAAYDTGRTVWVQSSLFTDATLAASAKRIVYDDWLMDTERSIVLEPTHDGIIRLDLETGNVLWRAAASALPSKTKSGAFELVGDLLLVRYDKGLFRVNRDTGAVVWARGKKFPAPVAEMAMTPSGLLVRGSHNVDGKGNVSWKPYVTLVDPSTGASTWTTEGTKFEGRSRFLLEDGTMTMALKNGVATYDVASGRVVRTLPMAEFLGGEAPTGIERLADGGLRLSSSQNVRRFSQDGQVTYSTFLKAPGASFLTKFVAVAIAAAASGASMAAASPGGFYSVYSPGAGAFQKFKATTATDRYLYVFTEEDGARADRFALVRLDKETGRATARINLTDRAPVFKVDADLGHVLLVDDAGLHQFRFPE